MGLLGKSFEEQVKEALATVGAKVDGLSGLSAEVEGKVVTLHGKAKDLAAKKAAMREFIAIAEAQNTVNAITVEKTTAPPLEAPPVPPPSAPRVHEVKSGDTLSALAKQYYGKGSLYMKIYEANRDQLQNPDIIRIGQKLKIPD